MSQNHMEPKESGSVRTKIVCSVLACFLSCLIGLALYSRLPGQIPVQFSFQGEPQTFAPKAVAIFGLPALLAAVDAFVLFATFPHAKPNPALSKKVSSLLFVLIPLIGNGIMVAIYLFLLQPKFDPVTFISVLLGLLFIALGNYMPKASQNSVFGFRIYWTLKNAAVWRRINRLGGILLVGIGILMVLCGLFGLKSVFEALIVITIGMGIGLSVYSKILYDRLEKRSPSK